jgi:hypothetical protein
MNNTELLERINSAIELGTGSVDLLKECYDRIGEMERRIEQIATTASIVRKKPTADEMRGALEEVEAAAKTPFPE